MREAAKLQQAPGIAGRSTETVRRSCEIGDIGRRFDGRWAVSRVALAMFLDGDEAGLRRHLHGEQSDAAVASHLGRAGLWSNGPVEGQINRLKLIKCSMYGRVGLDLLRQLVLHAD
jgi:hypothetical protein